MPARLLTQEEINDGFWVPSRENEPFPSDKEHPAHYWSSSDPELDDVSYTIFYENGKWWRLNGLDCCVDDKSFNTIEEALEDLDNGGDWG